MSSKPLINLFRKYTPIFSLVSLVVNNIILPPCGQSSQSIQYVVCHMRPFKRYIQLPAFITVLHVSNTIPYIYCRSVVARDSYFSALYFSFASWMEIVRQPGQNFNMEVKSLITRTQRNFNWDLQKAFTTKTFITSGKLYLHAPLICYLMREIRWLHPP